MTQRTKCRTRCTRCRMRPEICICNLIPSLTLGTRVVLVISHREVNAPTNTGRLAGLSLTNSAVLVRGDLERPYDLRDHLMPDRPSLLLYPDPEAEILSPELMSRFNGPVNLVVPDGNWRQATKMRRRDPHMAALPIVKIPPGRATEYLVRREPKEEGMATIEAIARALGIMEGAEVQMALEGVFKAMVHRTLSSRGTLQKFMQDSVAIDEV